MGLPKTKGLRPNAKDLRGVGSTKTRTNTGDEGPTKRSMEMKARSHAKHRAVGSM